MLSLFVFAVAFTVGVSFICSLFEALILSTSVAEIEALKKSQPKKGALLESLKSDLSNTISAILTLNTVANTAGSATVGGLAAKLFGDPIVAVVTGILTFCILIFSEIIPKNLGVAYRVKLQPWIVYPLQFTRVALSPITYLTNLSLRFVVNESSNGDEETSNEEEIILLAEKGAKEGTLTEGESDMVANALKLDDVIVSEIMTPRVVVTALDKTSTIDEVFHQYPNLLFARIPVYDEEIDNIVGIARRRDLLTEKANDNDSATVAEVMDKVHFCPETITVAAALQKALKTHQQLLVVVDEYGSVAGVVTMEDIVECILGQEIFEKDDVAIDMRELARSENLKTSQGLVPKSDSASAE